MAARFQMPGSVVDTNPPFRALKPSVPPQPLSPLPPNGIFWYSFDFGPIHFTIFSSEHNFTRGSTQYAWLRQDLHAVNRTRTPWLVVSSHRPLYTSEKYPDDLVVVEHLRAELEPLFLNARVDLYLAGHYHSYERTCPLAHGKLAFLFVVHFPRALFAESFFLCTHTHTHTQHAP
jgi:hypothetical protein